MGFSEAEGDKVYMAPELLDDQLSPAADVFRYFYIYIATFYDCLTSF
jgi:hypothetical protein